MRDVVTDEHKQEARHKPQTFYFILFYFYIVLFLVSVPSADDFVHGRFTARTPAQASMLRAKLADIAREIEFEEEMERSLNTASEVKIRRVCPPSLAQALSGGGRRAAWHV